MSRAACLPAPVARITVAEPVTMSPPSNGLPGGNASDLLGRFVEGGDLQSGLTLPGCIPNAGNIAFCVNGMGIH